MPAAARPAENVVACCSAIPTSKYLSGNSSENAVRPTPSGIAAVIPTILSFSLASSHTFSEKIFA